MNIEENRLQTFTDWPANAAVDAARIAKAGFYYSGYGLEVQCFLCGVKISDWNYGDQAIVRHRLAEPNCSFVQNPSSTCNIPLIPINNNELASSSTEISQNNIIEYQSINSCQYKESRKKYRIMSHRLQSFTNWPLSSIVLPENLAKAGFYYLQHDDEVQCIYCGGILKKWELGDDPNKKHRKYFPNCNFYVYQDKDDNLYLSNVKLISGTTSNLSDLGIQTHTTPKKQDCATYEGRLHTFNGWPKNIKQTPEILASAGFYYDGYSDHVRCFHCDGGLRNWETTDDVWIEHAKWFPKCEFVNLVRGQEFIKQCINNRPPLDQSIFEDVTKDQNIDKIEMSCTSSSSLEITETTLKKLLENPLVTVALEIGLHIDRVKKALKKRIEEVGIPYTHPDQLIEDVLCGQIMEESTKKQTSNIEKYNNIKKNEYKEHSTENEVSMIFNHTANRKTNVNFNEITSLEEENRKLKEARLCKICMDREIAIVFLPCGHLATCVYCAPSLTYCLMCRQEIKAIINSW